MTELLFDKLAYIDRLTKAGIDEPQARAHGEALEEALRDGVATRSDILRVENKIELAVRDLTIRMGVAAVAVIGILASIRFFGH